MKGIFDNSLKMLSIFVSQPSSSSSSGGGGSGGCFISGTQVRHLDYDAVF